MNYALLFALHREAAPFLHRHRGQRIADEWPTAPPCDSRFLQLKSKSVSVLITGVGFDNAGSAVDWALANAAPDLVIAAGFAGALDAALGVGEVIVASEVVEPDGEHWRTVLPAELGDCECGRILTALALVGSQSEKRAARRSTGAAAVDMESAAIAEACQGARVPCAVIRAISDSAETTMSPHLVGLLSGPAIAPGRVLAALVRRPQIAGEFWRLARATALAAESLADALDTLMS